MVNLLGLDLDALVAHLDALQEKRFRAVQLFRWIHRAGESDFSRMTDIARSLREKLQGRAVLLRRYRQVAVRRG
jgi:23S rRNA (adenine2503-C2)-methyltransferase